MDPAHSTAPAIPAAADLDLVHLCDNPIIRIDREGRMVVVNPAAARLLGGTPDSLTGQPIAPVLAAESLSIVDRWNRTTGRPAGEEALVFRPAGGGETTRRVVPMAVEGPDGPLLQLVVRVDAQTGPDLDLVGLHTRSLLGGIAAEVGHELNNHLFVLSGYAQLLPLHLQRGEWERVEKDACMVQREVERAKVLVRGLLVYGMGDDDRKESDLNDAIRTAVTFLDPLNRFDHIQFRTSLEEGLPLLPVPPSLLRSLIVHLLHASADVLGKRAGEGGEVHLRTIRPEGMGAAVALIVENRGRVITDPRHRPSSPPLAETVARRLAKEAGARIETHPRGSALTHAAERIELFFDLSRPLGTDGAAAGDPEPCPGARRDRADGSR